MSDTGTFRHDRREIKGLLYGAATARLSGDLDGAAVLERCILTEADPTEAVEAAADAIAGQLRGTEQSLHGGLLAVLTAAFGEAVTFGPVAAELVALAPLVRGVGSALSGDRDGVAGASRDVVAAAGGTAVDVALATLEAAITWRAERDRRDPVAVARSLTLAAAVW